jgi:hypothetical protein
MNQAFEMEIEFISISIVTFFYILVEYYLKYLHLYQKLDSFGFIYQKNIYEYWG